MTPEERREAQIDAIGNVSGNGYRVHTVGPHVARERLLAHFDEYEPAVADAIRYGLNRLGFAWDDADGDIVTSNEAEPDSLYVINYPEGHPKR